MELDLSGLTFEQINNPAAFEYAVLSNPDNRDWICSLREEKKGATSGGEDCT
ncbi:hypothetical protein [Aeromonas hydrophila]|uniref:hypothetical protein n=1 Tax=Aeromonas hydrophila TaxID=644 RepID=UPI00280C83DC|nr:hypothetical protein [Aeromonas hydrophila]